MRATLPMLSCAGLLLGGSATADRPAEAAVRATLETWTEDFNAGRAAAACDLFAPDLRYDYPGFAERGYQAMCDLLHRSLGDRTRKYAYALDIREILPAGDLAIVRLVWTLNVAGADGAVVQTSRETGMDVFRRQPDGAWRIVRFIAYEAP